jgi:hypothetical protein
MEIIIAIQIWIVENVACSHLTTSPDLHHHGLPKLKVFSAVSLNRARLLLHFMGTN